MLTLDQFCKSNNQDVIEMQNPVLIQKQHSIKVYQYYSHFKDSSLFSAAQQ